MNCDKERCPQKIPLTLIEIFCTYNQKERERERERDRGREGGRERERKRKTCFLYFLRQSFAFVTQAGVQWHDFSSPQPPPPAPVSRAPGIRGTCHHALLIFVYLVHMAFRHVDQSSLELVTSRNSPGLASQVAGTTGMCQHTWLIVYFC